jgi:hypothetical protein
MNPQLPRKRRTLPTQAARFEEMNERCARIILSDRCRYPKTSSPSQLATPKRAGANLGKRDSSESR